MILARVILGGTMVVGGLVWLGYAKGGGRIYMERGDLEAGVSIVGGRASLLADAIAFSSVEDGMKGVVLDLGWPVAARTPVGIAAFGHPAFLFDLMKISQEAPGVHAQLVAAAYGSALDLSFEQEAILDGACQEIALEDGVASPAALSERLDRDETGGNSGKRLRGRLRTLTGMSATGEEGVLGRIAQSGGVLCFGGLPTLEMAELGASLVIARLLALSASSRPDLVVIPQANRLFKGRPIFRQNPRLLSAFVSSGLCRVMASPTAYGLDQRFLDTSEVRISGGNASTSGGPVVPPGMFLLRNLRRGFEEVFCCREFEETEGELLMGTESGEKSKTLALDVLDAVSAYQDSTPASVAAFVSPEHSKETVARELEGLIAQGFVELVSKEVGTDSPRRILKLTAKGAERLRGGA